MQVHDSPSAGGFHQPALSICLEIPRQHPGATGDALLSAKALMSSSIPVVGLPDDFVSSDDERLFAFISTLRASVKARVAAEQQRGHPLSEIVVQVREMTRVAEREAPHPKPFSAHAFRAIAKQAIAWSIESFRPAVFADRKESIRDPFPTESLP